MLNKLKSLFKDHFWDFYRWSQEVPIDTPIEEVKIHLPTYVKVDWVNPESMGKGLLYPVSWIKGYKKRQKIFLGFVDNLFSGCIIRG